MQTQHELEWESAQGVICPACERETLRIIDGICPQCANAKEFKRIEEQEDIAMRKYYTRKLREGTIDLGRMREGLL